ncbi:sensor histidine kinase [Candidatus Protochlamydia phocaeensis]|uniref:sensor histidine kinase n=1 Tax=Candidatus Protochlamydia phocaeensis TaxID=1414722 RepID=UPI0008387987|nr:ATP-binding protein [Candidatus Protochlamydia phocaeensis]
MLRSKSFLYNQSLHTQLILWFFLIAFLPLGWTTFISYEVSKKIILKQATNHLQALSLRQAQLIENYFHEKERSTASLARGTIIPKAIKDFATALAKYGQDSSEYRAEEKLYRPIFTFEAETLGYRNLFLVTKEGEIVFSAFPSLIRVGSNLSDPRYPIKELSTIFLNARDLLESEISPLIYSPLPASPSSYIATPLIEQNNIMGVLLAQIDNTAIYNLVEDYNGLGETGETLLVDQDGSEILTITPLRHLRDMSAIHEVESNSSFGQFIQRVLEGKRLVAQVVDYRNKATLMVGRHFEPSLHWGIITKMDMNELLAPINQLKYSSWILAITTAIIVILMASNVARNITHPLLVLTKKTRLMAAGDLSQRIDISTNNEIGRLAASFNDMASQLDNMVKNLDTLVAMRTEEVELQNIQLERTIEELRQTQNRLITQEKLASLGALTAGIAHEIKNPLNFINNFAELSLDIQQDIGKHLDSLSSLITKEEFKELDELFQTLKLNIRKILEHGKRADSIVYNMLQHSRGTPGEKVLINLNSLLDEYVTLSYHGMRAQNTIFNVKIEKYYDPTLPPIAVVPQEMSRVFLNLLNNAYYSVYQKSKSIKDPYTPIVRVSTENHQDLVIIKIWDNGTGIPYEVFPKLFTPFFTTKPTGEGTGLGLSLSYNIIVQGHNGTLIAETEPGQFAEFIISLPTGKKQH